MTPLSQKDKRWGSLKLGFSDTTIAQYGCTITALSMILGSTPDVVNERLKAVQGFAQGNLVIWAKLEEAFPGIKIKRVWSYDNADVLANVPNVLVEVDGKPIGGYRHWVVFIGNKKMIDPWDGKEKPTSSYPNPLSYCVIGGKWNKPSPQSNLQAELDKVREARDNHHNDLMKIKDALTVQGEYSIDNILNRIDSLSKSEMTLGDKDKQLNDVQSQLSNISLQLKNKIDEYIALQAKNEELHKEIETQAKSIEEFGIAMHEARADIERLKAIKSTDELSAFEHLVRFFVKLFVNKK